MGVPVLSCSSKKWVPIFMRVVIYITLHWLYRIPSAGKMSIDSHFISNFCFTSYSDHHSIVFLHHNWGLFFCWTGFVKQSFSNSRNLTSLVLGLTNNNARMIACITVGCVSFPFEFELWHPLCVQNVCFNVMIKACLPFWFLRRGFWACLPIRWQSLIIFGLELCVISAKFMKLCIPCLSYIVMDIRKVNNLLDILDSCIEEF